MRYLLQSPLNHRQVAPCFEHVGNLCHITATNRTEIAASLHLQFLSRARARQNCKKITRVNGPLQGVAFTLHPLVSPRVNTILTI